MDERLQLEGIDAGYGGARVLEGVGLEVGVGEVVCLLGANGAGKTTMLLTIAGLLRPSAGRLTWAGQDLLRVPPHRIVEQGIALSPEGRQLFPNLTVLENLQLGSYCRHARPYRQASLGEVYALFPRLHERRDQAAGLLSGGEQQMLAIGRALMARPRLLLLDEPSVGLAPRLVAAVFESIARIASQGIGVLLVEQNAYGALAIAKRGYVLANGRVVTAGLAAQLEAAPEVQAAFIG
ncbi:MAG: ABC transporter ATP-binding protein [Candidatus Lambdaproteobacteria bacterium]|nr:ABC transporter ATP-binding protein [Candidatus Lambdaproteobacteria bacterium]